MKTKKVRPCGESSPYWDYVRASGRNSLPDEIHEPLAANLDQLPEKISKFLPLELEAILEILDEGGEQILSPREKSAFQLVVREGISYREAARKMGCSFHSVEQYVKRAALKLRKLCQTKL